LVGARLKQSIALITRNRTENRKRWNVNKLDETDVEHYYQKKYNGNYKKTHRQKIQGKNGHV
jgi:hypothetical protein